jgi:hypothetical protein
MTLECRSDGDYAGRPLAVTWCGERMLVAEILKAWRAPDGKCYRICTQNGQVFELIYSEFYDSWSIIHR